jgi:hypothetical protein
LKIRTSVIPDKPYYINHKPGDDTLDPEAICIFAACGFFLEKDTYFKNRKALQPATDYETSENGSLAEKGSYWKWHYSPRDISLSQATDEFARLLEKITGEEVKGRKVILPLSGGLDSRTQAAAMPPGAEVQAYSYEFADSFNETKYGKAIAAYRNYPFHKFIIPEGYLWDRIEDLAEHNGCYSEFTHPRQMAVTEKIEPLGNLFHLGHWGDVLFDDMGVADDLPFEEQVNVVQKKVIKKGGMELGNALWQMWGLKGNFSDYLRERISSLLKEINIDNANARIRAFKSLYWAPRWTSVNLCIFSNLHPVALPYFDPRMCEFICTVPEKHLSGRQIQIEYLKKKAPALAAIPWQVYDPYNLYNYKNFGSWSNIPRRAVKKMLRIARENVLQKPPLTTRNWEIQFTGERNDAHLKHYLFENPSFKEMIPKELVKDFYDKFREKDPVWYSHPLSMLLTLSLFSKQPLKS